MLHHFFFFKQKTAYEMRISDWSSDVCSSDLHRSEIRRALDPVVPLGCHPGERRRQEGAAEAVADDVRIPLARGAFHRVERRQWQIGRASCRERVCQYV